MKETIVREFRQHLGYLFSPASCIKRGLLLVLAIVHEFTKHHTARIILLAGRNMPRYVCYCGLFYSRNLVHVSRYKIFYDIQDGRINIIKK